MMPASLFAFQRVSPFENSVVIRPRREGHPIRPASTVASLQSLSNVEQENAPDEVFLGATLISAPSDTGHSVAAQEPQD
ncbi:hypothetical protein PF003_g116 [Phytophthora fragariae]|nr:hypothetical protein PF003_g116 [Phytophthora fragariae]